MYSLCFTITSLGSEVSCPRTPPMKNPGDPVWFEPGASRLRVTHFTTEPRGTAVILVEETPGKPEQVQ